MMMKRSIALLSGCLMLLLTACGASTPIPSGTEPAPLSPSPKDQGVRYQAELEEVSGESREGDILLLSYRYEVPVLRAYGEDGAELPEAELPERAKSALTTFNENFSYWRDGQDAQEVESWAREDYASMKDILPIWTEGRGYSTEFTSELYETEGGGAHPNTMYAAWNFDLESGSFVEPGFLAADAQAFQEAVAEEIIRQADAVAETEGVEPGQYYWEEYRDIAAKWADYAVNFDGEGMTVTFAPYEIACYAAGTQEFRLDRDFLGQYLSAEGLRLLGY